MGIISGLGHGFNSYGISVFFKDLAAELNLNRAITSLATGLGRLEGGAISPLTGWLSDKFGPKWPIVCGICIASIGMILMNFITEVWHYFVVWGLLMGFGINLALTVAVDKLLNDWFLRKRGLAHGIKFALIGVFGVAVLQIITPIVLSEGWRITCLIWGMIMFASVPFAFAIVRNEIPEHYGLFPDGATPESYMEKNKIKNVDGGTGDSSDSREVEYTFKQTIRTRSYWLLVFAFGVQNLVGGGFVLHVIPFLTDLGIDPTAASFMMGIMIFFTIPARFFGGISADRFRKNQIQFLLAGVFFLQFIGILTFILYQNTASIYALLICHGLSTGASWPIMLVMLGRYFGRQAFGSILGTLLAFLSPMLLLAPVYSGWIYDTTGSYLNAFITFCVLVIISTSVMFFVRPPR